MTQNQAVILTAIFMIALFFTTRNAICWYFKINAILRVLERIAAKLEAPVEATLVEPPPPPAPPPPPTTDEWTKRMEAALAAKSGTTDNRSGR